MPGFCSSKFLGRTCKDWGNPICSNLTVDALSVDVEICGKGSCVNASFTGTSVFCDNIDNAATTASCEASAMQDSLVYCIAGACRNSDFAAADVTCVDGREGIDSCASTKFRQSKVSCFGSSCANSIFEASQVLCDGFYSCDSATYDDCSCCDGSKCPTEVLSCDDDPVTFCSGRFVDCAALGNPMCTGISGQTNPTVEGTAPNSPLAPSPTDSTGTPVSVVNPTVGATPTPSPSLAINSPSTINGMPTTTPAGPITSTPTVQIQCDGINNISAISGVPVTIPSCLENVASTTVLTWPRNGSLTVKDNGSVVYVPNVGFVGLDVIVVETCSSTGDCFDVTMNVQIVEPDEKQSPENGNGGSKAYLAVLAVILIIGGIAGYFLYKRKQQQSSMSQSQGSGPSFKAGTSVNASTFAQSDDGPSLSTFNVSTVNQSVDGPSLSTHKEVGDLEKIQQPVIRQSRTLK